MRKYIFYAIISLVFALEGTAQVYRLPVRRIGGEDFYTYTVAQGEGINAVCRKLNITMQQLLHYNPIVADGLKRDQLLYFPVSKFSDMNVVSRPVGTYTALAGDTPYGIAKKFGMTIDEFINLNPVAESGVKTDCVYKVYENATGGNAHLLIVDAQSKANDNTTSTKSHTIKDQETLYSIANTYGCTVSELKSLNPGLNEEHYEIGQTIIVPSGRVFKRLADTFDPNSYVVKNEDTFYGIARSHGITIQQLQEANPGINILTPGMRLSIPQACENPNDASQSTAAADMSDSRPQGPQELPLPHTVSRVKIALALPFQSGLKDKTRQARSYGDFYRGFILGVDSLKSVEQPVTILAYDVNGDTAQICEILKDPRLKEASAIIVPDNNDAIKYFARFGNDNDIDIINIFSTKDEEYLTNKSVFQGNIPYDDMVAKAVDYQMSNLYGTPTIVVLRQKGANNKEEVVEKIIKVARNKGLSVVSIDYDDKLTPEMLGRISKLSNIVFLPATAKTKNTTQILEVLSEYISNRTDNPSVKILGYPEWIALKGKPLSHMKQLDTTIYSRFAPDSSNPETTDLEEKYKKWYGHDMPAGVPRQSLAGFDVAIYLIKTLRANSGDFNRESPAYDGILSPYHFVKATTGGWVNDSMYIINYRPSGAVNKISL